MTKDEKEDIRQKANEVADAIERLSMAMNEHYLFSVRRKFVIAEDILPGDALMNDIDKYRGIAKIMSED